jgi:hypothetical protein
MKGHIRERSPGHWAIIIDAKDPDTGKRRRVWHSFKGTKRQAQVRCAELIGEHKAGRVNLAPGKLTTAEFLQRWLEHKRTRISPYSFERYEDAVTKTLIPLLGAVPLAKLQPVVISQAYAEALESGRCDGRGGLSAKTVGFLHRLLRQSLDCAMTWNLLSRNPTHGIKPPRVERRQMAVYDADGVVRLIETARGTKLFIAVLLGALSSPRRDRRRALAGFGPRARHAFRSRERGAVAGRFAPRETAEERQGPYGGSASGAG